MGGGKALNESQRQKREKKVVYIYRYGKFGRTRRNGGNKSIGYSPALSNERKRGKEEPADPPSCERNPPLWGRGREVGEQKNF